MNKTIKTVIFSILLVSGIFLKSSLAQEPTTTQIEPGAPQEQMPTEVIEPTQETLKGLVLEIVDQGTQEIYGVPQKYIVYKVRILDGDKKGEEIEITAAVYQDAEGFTFKPGNKVLILHSTNTLGEEQFYITDYLRINPMIFLALIFVVLVLLVSKKWGLSSIIGLIYSFFVIFRFMLPRLAVGGNPVLIAIFGAMLIAPVTFYLSHGFNRKTTLALLSTLISLVITGVLAAAFVELTNLTGYGTEEAFFLQYAKNSVVNIKGLLLAGIIIGTLGVLDDVTVNQAAIVFQLRKANRKLNATQTFHMAMNVGHDHIASMVNTLVLVYTGATLPLLLLFINSPVPAYEIINSEIIAEEIIRTLVGSIGLVLAVPITTVLAVKYYQDDKLEMKKK